MCVGESVLLGVGRDCGVVAGVPSPARWPGSARGRVGVLGCHGTALVLEALGGGTPCAPVADLGPWKAPFEGLLCSLAVARGPLPPWLLRFLAPKPFARRSLCLAASPPPPVCLPTRCRAPARWCFSGPLRPPIRVCRRRPRRWCRRVPTRGRSSRPTPCAPPSGARARARVGSPAVRCGRCGRALPPPVVGVGGRAPARLPSPLSPAGARRRPSLAPAWLAGVPAPPARRHRGRPGVCVGGVGAVPRLSAAPPPVRPRPRWRGPWPVSLARRCGRGRAVARWGASSRSPTLRAPALRGGGCCRCRRRRRMCAPPCSARPAHRETLCRAPLLGGAGGLWLTALLPG